MVIDKRNQSIYMYNIVGFFIATRFCTNTLRFS